MPLIRIPITEDTDHELPAIERGLLRLWHNDQIALHHNYILEIGCNESMFAKEMADRKNFVVGIDVRPYRYSPYYSGGFDEEANFLFIQKDASMIDINIIDPSIESGPDPTKTQEYYKDKLVKFDLGVAISSVEHFGLGEYGDIKDVNSDIKAMKNMWKAIKPKGVVMVTVPISSEIFRIDLGYIRKYDKQSLKDRIIQGNHIQRFEIITHPSGPDFVGGAKAFESFDFSDIDYKACIYLEMVKGEV